MQRACFWPERLGKARGEPEEAGALRPKDASAWSSTGGAWGGSCGLPKASRFDLAAGPGRGMGRGEEVGECAQMGCTGPLFRTTALWINACVTLVSE